VTAIAKAMQKTGLRPGAIFTHVNVSGSGQLTKTTFELALKSCPVEPPLWKMEVDALFKHLDKSHSSSVTRREFVAFFDKALKMSDERRAAAVGGGNHRRCQLSSYRAWQSSLA